MLGDAKKNNDEYTNTYSPEKNNNTNKCTG